MLLPTRTDGLRAAAAAVLAAGTLAGCLAWREPVGWPAALSRWDLVALVGGVCGLGSLAASAGFRWHDRRVLRGLERQLRAFRDNPATHGEALYRRAGPPSADLAGLVEAVELLLEGYRKALSDRVSQNEALEALRSLLGRVDQDRGLAPAVSYRGNTTSRDMVARFTPTMHWLTATPSLQQFLGYQMAELNARPFANVFHTGDEEILRRAFHEAVQTGEAHNVQFRLRVRRADDPARQPDAGPGAGELPREDRHVQMDMLTRYSELGVPVHVRCYLVDVSDRVRAENELRRRTGELERANQRLRGMNQDLQRLKESYKDLYHQAPVMYFNLDARGRFVTFNDTMLATLGYDREDLIRQPYTRLLPPESRDLFLQDRDAYQRPLTAQTRWVKKDGTVIDVSIRSTPVQDEAGRFLRSRSVAQDVTELRRRGEELEKKNTELQRINEALARVNSVVAHDLREPARTLVMYCNQLKEDHGDQLGEDGLFKVSRMTETSERNVRMIQELLDLARIGEVIREPRAFDLDEAVAGVCTDLDELIQRKHATVLLETPLPGLLGDGARVAQLLKNLIANGLNYNDKPEPWLRIGLAPRAAVPADAPAGFVTLCVADNGRGIHPDYHESIFGLFQRGPDAARDEGTGAGLAIARKVVEAHGGRIWVESRPGRGAVFYFTLPLGGEFPAGPPHFRAVAGPRPGGNGHAPPARVTEETRRSRPPAVPERQAALPADAPSVLLVEDMPEIAFNVERLAVRAGHRLTWVGTAEAAWDYLHTTRRRPDLVLLDVKLPGMNGIELCKQIRQTPGLDDLTVALFSQLAPDEAASASVGAEADHILCKDLLCHPARWLTTMGEILADARSLRTTPVA